MIVIAVDNCHPIDNGRSMVDRQEHLKPDEVVIPVVAELHLHGHQRKIDAHRPLIVEACAAGTESDVD